MVVVRIYGGLGNQLFQYAAAKHAALVHKIPLGLDISELRNHSIYSFDLGGFNISDRVLEDQEASKYVNMPTNFFELLPIKLNNRLRPKTHKRLIINETCYEFKNELSHITNNTYINGLWQSEKYFLPIRSFLLKSITLKNSNAETRVALVERINQTESVAVVIRRGDYLKTPALNLYSNSLDFYYKALALLQHRVKRPLTYFLFSDDIEWVMQNWTMHIRDTVFVSEIYPEKEGYKINKNRHLDLMLIKSCKHQIISNTSFGWWGAWLNENPEKVVIAPKHWIDPNYLWYNGLPVNDKDVIPETWITC